MEKCPFCGGSTGLEAVRRFTQFYNWDGKPDGYVFDYSHTLTARCSDCGKRVELAKLGEGG